MARTAQSYSCKHCGASGLFWTRVQGPRGISVRLADPVTGVHRCKEYEQARDAGKNLPHNPPVRVPYSPQDLNPVQPKPEPFNAPKIEQENKPEQENQNKRGDNKPYDDSWIKPYVKAEDAKLAETMVKALGESVTFLNSKIEALDAKREVIVKLEKPNGEIEIISGAHKCMSVLLRRVRIKQNCLIVGPAGSGKTHAAHMVAEALGLKFYPMSVGPQTSKSDLIGYVDAHGKLVRTVLREAYEYGGLFLLDEVDAGNPGVLTVLNALLANSVCSFPDGVIEKHPDFRCIAAGNTYGQGANRQYVGRQQLDAATLDRFVGIDWDYDESLESKLGASQPDWVLYVWSLRKAADKLGIKRVFGTRRIQQGTALLDDGEKLDDVKNDTVFFGCPAEDRKKLEANL